MAANPELVRADLDGRDVLQDVLGSDVPDNWPPELFDRTTMGYILEEIPDNRVDGWSTWYVVLTGSNELAGICDFKGRPDEAGSVEISYSVLEQFRGNGLATEATMRLIAWAFTHLEVSEVCAETFPHLKSSIRVLEKNGMKLTGPGSENGVIRYAVGRPDGR